MRDAVIVGIDRYPHAPLAGCVRDAADVADCLSFDNFGFDCEKLVDGLATRSNVLAALGTRAFERKGEVLLFYFAGHGQVLGGAGYLVLADGNEYDPGLSLAQLAQIMESAGAHYQHVIALLDCCHAGSAPTWIASRPITAPDIERELPGVNESRCVLAACRPEQVALEAAYASRGVFTAAIVDGLLGNAVDPAGNVSLASLYEYITRAVSPERQTPVFKGDVAGTVVLGQGFTPPKGPPLDRSTVAKTIAKAHQLVDGYYYIQQRELGDRAHRRRSGARACALELEPRLTWFSETERKLPDIARDPAWPDLTRRMREFQKNLADLNQGDGTLFGEVTGHIGHGGYGHVWEVDGPDGLRAFKVFHGNELDDQVKVQRFEYGYQNMRKLEHPRIVRVHELSHAPYGFAMDRVDGDNLRNAYIDPENAENTLRLLFEIGQTVQHAHSRGVRHRDIKPENILIVYEDGRPTPYLTDFDLAYHETNRTVTTNLGVGGVINYAAPEQLYEPNTAAARAETVDVFSLAQLMYFVITGGSDPSGEHFDKNREQLVRVLNSWVDDRAARPLLELYERATAKNPAERPQSVVEFLSYISQAEAFVQLASGTGKLREEDFCRRVGMLYAGLERFHATDQSVNMHSLSGQIEIVITLNNVAPSGEIDITIECSVTDKIPIPSMKSGVDARAAVNSRLDKALARYPHVKRHAGKKGAYQVFVDVSKLPSSIDGVTRVNDVLVTTVAGIEQW